MYLYVKALHIIFIVTWFAGLFYIVRLFIYNTEANEKGEPDKSILQKQFTVMIKRLWLGITWPSAVLTAIFGPWMWSMLGGTSDWLWIKLAFVFICLPFYTACHLQAAVARPVPLQFATAPGMERSGHHFSCCHRDAGHREAKPQFCLGIDRTDRVCGVIDECN
jgi:uncharacterized integral membrane protein (TIGR00701 family)